MSDDTNLSVEEQAIELIIKFKLIQYKFDDFNNRNTLNFIYRALEKDNTSIPYDYIADYVYNNIEDDVVENNEWLSENIRILVEHYNGKNRSELEKNLTKIEYNYKLSVVQRSFIRKNIERVSQQSETLKGTLLNLEERAKSLEEKAKSFEEKAKSFEETAKSLEESKSSLYIDVIAVLGVFSSFVFVMFGGFSALSDILSSLGKNNSISIARTILISSILISFIFTIVYSLLLWVAKITGKVFVDKTCSCERRCNNILHIYGRHRYYLTIIIIMFILSIVSIFL